MATSPQGRLPTGPAERGFIPTANDPPERPVMGGETGNGERTKGKEKKEGFDNQNTQGENERLIESTETRSGPVPACLSLKDFEIAAYWQAL